MDGRDDRALLVAMPLRHLEAARALTETGGVVTLPAGGPGDLDETTLGVPVLIIATDAGDQHVPAATWTARFEGRVPHSPSEPWPDGLPWTWLQEHGVRPAPPEVADPPDDHDDDEEPEDDEEPDDEAAGPQSFFRVTGVSALERSEWVFANELVPKQQRGGRTFVPRQPRLITPPA